MATSLTPVAKADTRLDAETSRALGEMEAATQKAFRLVIDRQERWVAYSLRTGELDQGHDDYRQLCDQLIQEHGEDYFKRLSIIGPLY